MIVFVHGVPETAAIWDRLRDALERPSVAVALPGFGCARPDGFAATKEAYAAWLIDELSAFADPVDLVGHDWGAGLAARVAMTRPELLRSWTIDVPNIIHPDYRWHDVAVTWQTPEVGEAAFAHVLGQEVEVRAQGLGALGVAPGDAREMAGWLDPTMAGCILALYRSATPNIHADWGPLPSIETPGLALLAVDDPFGDDDMAASTARMLGARIERFDGGHFWPFSAARAVADVLERFWSDVDAADDR